MTRLVPLALISVLCAGPALADRAAVLAVEYRLVGEDAPAPEKARMVEEQVIAAIADAGFEALRGAPVDQAVAAQGTAADCARECLARVGAQLDASAVIAVAVAESGALYELRVAVADREALTGRITGPFSAALAEVKRLASTALAPLPEAAPAPVVAATEPAADDPAAQTPPPAEPDAAEPPAADPPVAPAEERRTRILRGGAWGLTVAGGAALIAGVVLLFVDDPCVDEHPEYGCKERLDTTVPGMPLAGLGGIAAGLGVAGLVFIGRGEEEPATQEEPAAATAFGLAPVPGGGVASYRLRF